MENQLGSVPNCSQPSPLRPDRPAVTPPPPHLQVTTVLLWIPKGGDEHPIDDRPENRLLGKRGGSRSGGGPANLCTLKR